MFMPVVPLADIERAGDAWSCPRAVPRMTLAQLGLPVDPARAADAIDTELAGARRRLRARRALRLLIPPSRRCHDVPAFPPSAHLRARSPLFVVTARHRRAPAPRARMRTRGRRSGAARGARVTRERVRAQRSLATRVARRLRCCGARRRHCRRCRRRWPSCRTSSASPREIVKNAPYTAEAVTEIDAGAARRQSHRAQATHAARARQRGRTRRSARATAAPASTSSIRSTARSVVLDERTRTAMRICRACRAAQPPDRRCRRRPRRLPPAPPAPVPARRRCSDTGTREVEVQPGRVIVQRTRGDGASDERRRARRGDPHRRGEPPAACRRRCRRCRR